MKSKQFFNDVNKTVDILMKKEFTGLNPFECLLKILKDNKKHAEQNNQPERLNVKTS